MSGMREWRGRRCTALDIRTLMCINVYDWSGNLVKKGVVVPNLIATETNNNVQSMCVINGEYYFLVCRWGSGGEIVKVSFDTSVLK